MQFLIMRLLSDKYPNSIFICFLWSIVGMALILLDINSLVRMIIALPILLFIPGYLLVFVLFPAKKTDEGITDVDRIALSLGLSLAVLPLAGVFLYYTPWGMQLVPIVVLLELLIVAVGLVAIFRWFRISPDNRYSLRFTISLPKDETRSDKALTVVLVVCMLFAGSLAIFTIFTPKREEHFTEFYILGPSHQAYNYPIELMPNQSAVVILGVVNHEKTVMNYTIEVWLSNQTTEYNASTKINETVYHNFWFVDKIQSQNMTPQPIVPGETQPSQWEEPYLINVSQFHLLQNRSYRVVFLLYTTPTQNYLQNADYRSLAPEKAESDHTTAYRSLFLWINVQ